MKCFLDVDGCLANFLGGVSRLFGVSLDPWPEPGGWSVHPHLGVSEGEFWARIHGEGARFWAGLRTMHDAHTLLALVESTFLPEDVYLLTSPSREPACWAGKAFWVDEYFREYRDRLLMGRCKSALAHHGAVLIDDHDGNVDLWRAAGGQAILVARPWNRLHQYAGDTVDLLQRDLRELVCPAPQPA